ncbi:MAG: aldose 1-epimerase family protein [Bacteroidetes bacterium]|nr:MAG: aldose 1-epimerase family protein [Bacteroidota bacterium]
MFVLENEFIRLEIKAQGAEMTRLFGKNTQTEYLWNADPAFWSRHAPVLFPIVGRLRNDAYTWKGQKYAMSQHGFARDKVFHLVESGSGSLVLELLEDDESLAKYPFPFRLLISYHLEGQRVRVGYEIENTGAEDLPYSIGAHPGFMCPLHEGESIEDYELVFEQAETASIHLLQGGLFSGEIEPFLDHQNRIALTPALFDRDALVFKYLASRWVDIVSRKTDSPVLRVGIDGLGPFLGIWAKPGAPFVCIEPWQGLADSVSASGDLMQKEGIALLGSGQNSSYHFDITLFS